MKFKKLLLTLGAVFAFSLAACNNKAETKTDTTPNNQTQGDNMGTQTDSTYLTFVGDGKIRIDIMDTALANNFTYGNAIVESKKEMAYSSDTKLAVRGSISAESVNFVIVIDKEGADSVAVNKGMVTDTLSEYLSQVMVLSGGKKVYVAISTGDVSWTKGLNSDLDAKLNQLNTAV